MRRSRPGATGERHWRGGFYELALLMDGSDQGRLGDGIKALAAAAGLSGATIDTAAGPVVPDLTTAEGLRLAAEALAQGRQLRGRVLLPAARESACGVLLLRDALDAVEDPGSGPAGCSLVLFLPLAGLASAGVEVGGFPFGDRSGVESHVWRRPLDEWLARIGRAVHVSLPFRRAVIGFDVAGDDELSVGTEPSVPAPRDRAFLVQEPDGLVFLAADR
ncbi:hypothetical protein ACFWFR_05045 [Oerskovia sp. NPDC060287]|uniref:hypothetical protein n=1 Tax=Oerskovia sp. NPDC060287 TaxID=3347095 RepID=UPI003651ECB3